MAFELIPLPYPEDALEPAVSGRTLHFHHDKHHRAYIDKTNGAIEGTDLDGKQLRQVIESARRDNRGLFNNSGQAWNHGFYWNSLTPRPSDPSGPLADAISSAFGSIDELKKQLASRGAGHFASGWVWLAAKGDRLSVEQTHDGDTLADSDMNPLLVIDLWEHAYYLDRQNDRAAYLDAVIGKLNWDFAAENLARGSAWEYPGAEMAMQD